MKKEEKTTLKSKSQPTPLPVTSPGKDPGNSFYTIPAKLQCEILRYMTQSQLLTFRLICCSINETIKIHFIFNTIINDVNLSRSWSPGLLLPWSRKVKRKPLSNLDSKSSDLNDKIFNIPTSLVVGRLQRNFTPNLTLVSNSIQKIEFTQPITVKNIKKILKECSATLHILRIHSSVFLGFQKSYTSGCTLQRVGTKFAKIEIDVTQLSKLFIILDEAIMSDITPCVIPYWLKINLSPPSESTRYDLCEIQFIPQGLAEDMMSVYKSWIVDDEIIDIFSRPDILRKITYFATVTEAELRHITIKFIPHLAIPSSVQFTKVINHPGYYPQLKKYPTGPFNGTTLTYFSTKRKGIFTYTPIHLHTDMVTIRNFPEAAQLLLSERTNS